MLSSMTTLKFEIPKGLPSLIHRLSKAIIRAQPDDLYEFCATYLEEELRIRDKQHEQPPETTDEETDMQYDKRRDDSGKYSGQEDFAKKEYEHQMAATKIQAGFRGYKTRKEMKLVKRRSTEEESKKLKSPQLSTITEEEEAQAATKIQAGVRGYLTRKKMKHSMDRDKSQSVDMGEFVDEASDHLDATPENVVAPNSQEIPEFAMKTINEEAEMIPVSISGGAQGASLENRSAADSPEETRETNNDGTDNNSKDLDPDGHPEVPADTVMMDAEIVTKDEVPTIETLPEFIKEGADSCPPSLSSVSEHLRDEMNTELSSVEPECQHGAESEKQAEEDTENLFVTKSSPSDEERLDVADTVAWPALQAETTGPEPKATEIEIEQHPDSFADEIKSLDEVEEMSVTETAEDAGSVVITPEPTTAVELEKQSFSREAGDADATEAPGDEPKAAEINSEPITDTKREIPKEAQVQVVKQTQPNVAEEVPVQRRSSKRKTATGTEKYRSGVVVDSFLLEDPTPMTNIHQLRQLDELDAEIESDAAEMNSAAARIQAGFRGYQVRKGLNNAATKIQSNYRGYKARKDLRNQANAAVKIQATVRGYLARKRVYKTRAQQLEQRRRDAARRRSSSSILAANLGLAAARKRNSE